MLGRNIEKNVTVILSAGGIVPGWHRGSEEGIGHRWSVHEKIGRGDVIVESALKVWIQHIRRLLGQHRHGVRREFDTLFKTQAERWLRDLDLVKREEFEAVREMAVKAREENDALAARIAELEAKIASLSK